MKIYFDVTEEEASADEYRCCHEDVIIQDYFAGKIVPWFDNKEDFKEYATNLIGKQADEVWVNGLGWLDKREVNIFIIIKGLLKRLLKLRVDFRRKSIFPEEHIPF